jgi:capsule polysaccharide export protein KpsE/RkpR
LLQLWHFINKIDLIIEAIFMNVLISPSSKLEHLKHKSSDSALSAKNNWVSNATLFWDKRHIFAYAFVIALFLSVPIVCLLPKQYESSTRIMPPEQPNNSMAMLAALAGKGAAGGSSGGLAGIAGSLFGAKNSGALFVALLRSGTISNHLVERFELQHVYRTRYRIDTAKRLARSTKITEDIKSGVINIVVTDKSPYRARDLAQGYLDELNNLVAKVNTSSAHRERLFIEQRLKTVQSELQRAQIELSDFSSKNTAIDLKEQTKAMVDAGAKLQGQLITEEAELDSMRQIYGNENVRVKAAMARTYLLQHELERDSGQSDSSAGNAQIDGSHPYPNLRQLPLLSVRWANLYRTVRIHETVFDLLSEEYETARIEEEKSIPTISVIDSPGIPERKSGPHRVLIVLAALLLSFIATGLSLIAMRSWRSLDDNDDKKKLFINILVFHKRLLHSLIKEEIIKS